MNKKIGLIDLDFPKYSVASIGQESYIEVKYLPKGRIKEFKNKQEFCGRNTKGGWLKETNDERVEKGLEAFQFSDFEITPKQRTKEDIANVFHSAKLMVESAIKESGVEDYEAYIGTGESFRVELSTLKEYKGERKNKLKPILLDDVSEYLTTKFNGIEVSGIEVDDKLVMRSVELQKQGYDPIIIGEDKDYMGCPVKFYNPKRPDWGVLDCRGFGKLWLEGTGSKVKVRGIGRLFKYQQILSEDSVDCYKANCFSDVKWAEKGAYNVLHKCEDDKQALSAMVEVFKMLYPYKKTVTGWRGNDIEIDWLYVMQEMFNMAHLQRWEGDRVDVKTLLDKLGVDYE